MAHIFFIDPIKKLTIKKDSSLILAMALQNAGEEVLLLFENNFFYSNKKEPAYSLSTFSGEWDSDGFYLTHFALQKEEARPFHHADILHMRLEPPFDKRYLNYLWMLQGVSERTGIKIINSPEGLLLYNEKISAYQLANPVDSFVGSATNEFSAYTKRLKQKGVEEIVLKPLDLYQGEGVEKMSLGQHDLMEKFEEKTRQSAGPVVAQPFLPEVYQGEIRSIFFNGRELGSMLKIPREGDFLSTVARGASCHPTTLTSAQRQNCEQTAHKLRESGVQWIAFDILGNSIQEVNITCPGLLPEISLVNRERLVNRIVQELG